MGPRSSGLVARPLYLLSQLNGTHHNKAGGGGGKKRREEGGKRRKGGREKEEEEEKIAKQIRVLPENQVQFPTSTG